MVEGSQESAFSNEVCSIRFAIIEEFRLDVLHCHLHRYTVCPIKFCATELQISVSLTTQCSSQGRLKQRQRRSEPD